MPSSARKVHPQDEQVAALRYDPALQRVDAMCDERYRTDEYVYGTEPNTYLAGVVDRIPPVRLLCLAEGEGVLRGLSFIPAVETEREVREGTLYAGRGAVVQILAVKPSPLCRARRSHPLPPRRFPSRSAAGRLRSFRYRSHSR